MNAPKFAWLTRWFAGHGSERALPAPYEPVAALDPTPESPAPDGRTARRLLAQIFDAAHPVRERGELHGRQRELDALLSATIDFRQHSVVHGARGSGKTSLVRVFGDYADQNGIIVIYMACEPDASFADLMLPYIQSIPPVAIHPRVKGEFAHAVSMLPRDFGPRMFVELMAETVVRPVVLILDEFDRIVDPVVKADMAAAMKLLSDALAEVLFMVVGIGRNVDEMVDSHPSLRRHMQVFSLGCISDEDVAALIGAGGAAAGLRFTPEAHGMIARAACGSPYHVRTFCHHAALAALPHGHDVEAAHVLDGFDRAAQRWQQTNEWDATVFHAVVREDALLPEIERVARSAAHGNAIPRDGGRAVDLLAPALRVMPDAPDLLTFHDTTAPQILISLTILAESTSATQLGGDAPQEDVHAVAR